MSGTTALDHARSAEAWTPVDWWTLEARALRGHPQAQNALARLAPREAWRHFRPERTSPWQPVLALTQLVSIVLPPVGAVLAVRQGVFEGGTVDLAVVGILVGVGALLALLGIVLTAGRPENTHPRTAVKIGAIHLLSGVVAAVVAVAALVDQRAEGPWWLGAMIVEIAVGASFLWRFRRLPKDDNADIVERSGTNLKRRLGELTPVQTVAIVDELNAAFDVLVARGLLTEADATAARRAPVGLLAVTMTGRDPL